MPAIMSFRLMSFNVSSCPRDGKNSRTDRESNGVQEFFVRDFAVHHRVHGHFAELDALGLEERL